MKICICGWYFHAPLMSAVFASMIPAFVVMNRPGHTRGIPSELSLSMSEKGGRGLEFGAYHQYLMNHWDGSSDVLFLQDDGELTEDALRDVEKLNSKPEINQAFIFRDEYEEFVNQGHTGRAFWIRGSALAEFKKAGGFDVDWSNTGNTEGRQANFGIAHFAKRMKESPGGHWIAIVPEIQMGRRGWIPTESYQYKRTEGQAGLVTPQSVL